MSDGTERRCTDCKHVLPPGKPGATGDTYGVECCTHPKVRNKFGVYATSLARRHDEKCGPDGLGWKAVDKPKRRA